MIISRLVEFRVSSCNIIIYYIIYYINLGCISAYCTGTFFQLTNRLFGVGFERHLS